MTFHALRSLSLLILLAAAPQRHVVYGPPVPPTPYDQCEAAVGLATKAVPPTLLPSIARVESGRLDPATGRVRPWPWTINVDGIGSFFETKEDAIATVQSLQSHGTRSIDIGCMQVNLFFHPTAFPSLEAGFDPSTNATFAANFLIALHAQSRDWNLAAAYYHSQTQERGEDYQRRLFGRVMTPMGPPLASAYSSANFPSGSPFPNTVFGAFLPASTMFGAFPAATTVFGAFAPAPIGPLVGVRSSRARLGRARVASAR